jgi:iron complex outermembrane receptor protein
MRTFKQSATPALRLAGMALFSANPALQAANSGPGPILEEVIITGQRIEAALRAEQALTPGGVSVVDGEDLYKRSVVNVADMLRYVPGVWAESSSGSDELFMSSRGSNLDATSHDKNGIKLLQDGLPITAADGNNHNRVVDPMSARYVVIARGANALTYGASTLGGAMDFVSATARTTAPLSVHLSGGSHGLLSGRATVGNVSGAFDGLLTLEAKSWQGYRDHSAQQRQGAYANASWQMSPDVTTRLYATFVDSDEELPGPLSRAQIESDPDQAAPQAVSGHFQKNVRTARGAFKTTWQLDERSSLHFGASYEDQGLYHPIVDVRVDPDGDGPSPPVQVASLLIETDHRTLGTMARYQAHIGEHQLLVGLNYGATQVDGANYGNDHGRRGGLNQYVDQSSTSLEAFAMDRWSISQAVTLVYGAQLVQTDRDVRTIDAASGSTVRNPKGEYSSINPRMGLIYSIPEIGEAFVSVSRLFEAPTAFELEDDVRQDDSLLDPMTGMVIEVGLRGSTAIETRGHWHWDVAVYYAEIEDETLSIDDPLAPGTSLSTNIDATVHAGIEALVGATLMLGEGAHRIEPLVSVTMNDFWFDSDRIYRNNDLPAAPKYVVRGELLYRHSQGFYVGPTFDAVGQRFADFSNTYSIEAYELLGLRGGFESASWGVFVELRNLLGEEYVATVSVRNSASANAAILYPGAPLSVFFGGRMSF